MRSQRLWLSVKPFDPEELRLLTVLHAQSRLWQAFDRAVTVRIGACYGLRRRRLWSPETGECVAGKLGNNSGGGFRRLGWPALPKGLRPRRRRDVRLALEFLRDFSGVSDAWRWSRDFHPQKPRDGKFKYMRTSPRRNPCPTFAAAAFDRVDIDACKFRELSARQPEAMDQFAIFCIYHFC
jgi:hypothetical protein